MRRFTAKLSKAWSNLVTSGFLRYLGPAVIVSTAYIDPGNFGTDVAIEMQGRQRPKLQLTEVYAPAIHPQRTELFSVRKRIWALNL